MSRVLVVAYGFPPRGGPAVQRPLKLVKYLSRFGWDATVLTVSDPPGALIDRTLEEEIPDDVHVVRAWSLEPTRLLQWVRRSRGDATTAPGASGAGAYSGRGPRFIRFVQSFFVPDEKRFWSWWAIPRAVRHASEHAVDVVVSTGPPHSAHLIGRRIARRLGVPHVVDMRDPWVGNYFFVPPTAVHAWLQARYERRILGGAGAVVVTAPSVATDVAARTPSLPRLETITNGFDPEDLTHDERPSGERFVLTYSGTFADMSLPDLLFRAVAEAEARRPELVDRLELRFAGIGDDVVRAAAAAGVGSRVVGLGYLSHQKAVSEVGNADVALLILATGAMSRMTIPGKVFEYLGLGKPILALAGRGDAADLVSSVEGGRVADPEAPHDVASALLELYDEWDRNELTAPAPEDAARYSRVEIARTYAMLLDEVIADA